MTGVLDQEAVESKAPDLVSVEDYESAVRILVELADGQWWELRDDVQRLVAAPGAVGKRWLIGAVEHIAQKLDRSFRDGPKLTTEHHAMAFVKGLAPHFLEASQALLEAAEALRVAGKVMPANRAYQAHKRAAVKAQELNP